MSCADAHLASAEEALRKGKAEDALLHCDAAVAARSGFDQAHFARGRVLASLGRLAEAAESFEAAAELSPAWAPAHANRALMLHRLERFQAAYVAFTRAIELDANQPRYFIDRAETALDLEQYTEALADADAAMALGAAAQAHFVRYMVQSRCGDWPAALLAARQGLAHDPSSSQLRLCEGFSLLALGRFAEGWRGFEERWRAPRAMGLTDGYSPTVKQRFASPYDVDLKDKSVLVVREQGVGDVIMFATILPDLLAQARSVAVLAEGRLLSLIGNSFPSIQLLGGDGGLDAFDHVLPIGSLGALYRRTVHDFPGTAVLTPSSHGRNAAANWLGPRRARRRVGISWRGGGKLVTSARRSIPLAQLEPILRTPDVEFVSLQYGDVREEIEAVNRAFGVEIRIPEPDALRDFDPFAAAVLEMDMVVSVQNSLVHLSGALGAPCRVMVPWAPEWRYGVGGETMPWYQSVRLVRQRQRDSWTDVIHLIAGEVKALALA